MKCRFFLPLLFPALLLAQSPAVIKITDLTKRIRSGNDTTYIVNFWATWCPPCVAELPMLDSLGQSHKDSKIKLFFVSINYKEDLETKLIPFLKTHNVRSEVCLLDENNFDYFPREMDKNWNGDIPCTFIVNTSRNIKLMFREKVAAAEIEDAIQKTK